MALIPIQLKGGLVQTPMVDPTTSPPFKLTNWWRRFFEQLTTLIESSAANVMPSLSFPGVSTALALTPLPTGTLQAGTYRISVYLRVVTAASISSSVQPVFTFTDLATVCTMVGGALTSNVPGLPASYTAVIRVDPGTPISISTIYASTGTAMVYDMVVELEQMGAVA